MRRSKRLAHGCQQEDTQSPSSLITMIMIIAGRFSSLRFAFVFAFASICFIVVERFLTLTASRCVFRSLFPAATSASGGESEKLINEKCYRDPNALGMESKNITDSQLSASSSHDPIDTGPQNAR